MDSAPAVGQDRSAIKAPGVHRRGGPVALVTGRCVFSFDARRRRFRLESVHPGESRESVAAQTGFAYDEPDGVPVTAPPRPGEVELLRGSIAEELADAYPRFAAGLRERAG